MGNIRKTLLAMLLTAIFATSSAQTYPYQDHRLSAKERAEDLCSRLTLQEKSLIMLDRSPENPRLGIPQFAWGS